jgi:hypothetical protein
MLGDGVRNEPRSLRIDMPIPETALPMIPTNRKLKAIENGDAGRASRRLLETWGRLHAIRTCLGLAATIAYIWALNP